MPDWLWGRIEPLLPAPPSHPLGCHRPRVPDRDAMDAILLVLRTGMQWNALNATGICSSSAAHRRFQEWERAGVFHEIWRQGLLDYDERGRDRLGLAGRRRGDDQGAAGRRRRPARIPLTELKRGEAVGPQRGGRGPGRARARRRQPQRPQAAEAHPRLDPDRAARADRRQPQGLCLDRGYDNPDVARARSTSTGSPRTSAPAAKRSSSKRAAPAGAPAAGSSKPATHGSTATARILIRWSKKDENHLALLQLACGLIAFKKAHAARLALAQAG